MVAQTRLTFNLDIVDIVIIAFIIYYFLKELHKLFQDEVNKNSLTLNKIKDTLLKEEEILHNSKIIFEDNKKILQIIEAKEKQLIDIRQKTDQKISSLMEFRIQIVDNFVYFNQTLIESIQNEYDEDRRKRLFEHLSFSQGVIEANEALFYQEFKMDIKDFKQSLNKQVVSKNKHFDLFKFNEN